MTDEFDTHTASEPAACPFVAFEDDRDHRSDAPDYRHRCFASAEPEPRAFPHQERYCLSPGFTACPVFLDWARQEAAGIARPSGSEVDRTTDDEEEPAPAFLASRPRAAATLEPATAASKRTADAAAGLWSSDGTTRRTAPTAPPPPSSLVIPPVAMARRGPTHPGWENPPRLESFPRLRSRDERHSNAPLIGAAVGVAVFMVALVLLPLMLGRGGSSTTPTSGPSSSGSGLVADATPTPAPTPTPTQSWKLETVGHNKWEANLTSIAAYYNVTPAQIVAFNADKPGFAIANPNVIWVGMQFYIPPVGWVPPPPTATPVPTPTPVPSPT